MKRNQSFWWRSSKVAAVVAAALLGFAPAVPAWAKVSEVHGLDHWYRGTGEETTGSDAKVNVVGMTGDEGDTVYLEVYRGPAGDGVKIASRLPYTLTAADEDGLVGIVSLDIVNYEKGGSYGIEVYSDRAESDLLYKGTMKNVYAKFEGVTEHVPIAARTLADGEDRTFEPPATIEYENTTYTLKSSEPDEAGDYLYEQASSIPDEVEGSVEYCTSDGKTLRTDTFTITKSEGTKAITLDNVVRGSDGSFYRSVQVNGYVTAKYPGVTKFKILCVPLDYSGTTGAPYTAKFRYVDSSTLPAETEDPATAGTEIGNVQAIGIIDELIVAGDSSYAPPKMICINKSDGTYETWVLDDAAQGKSYTTNGTYLLSPDDNTDKATEQTINIAYKKADDTTPGTWTVRLIDGSLPANDPNRIIEAYRFDVAPGESMTYQVVKTLPGTDQFGNELAADGDMVVTTDTLDSYGYEWSADRLIDTTDIYYVPDNYVEEDSYDVTLNLVNIATGETIRSTTHTMTPQYITDRSYLTLTPQSDFPDSFEQSGETYVRLDGQTADIKHSYYNFDTASDGSKTKTYTVYYRNVNDDLHATTTVSSVRVIYDGTVDRGVTSYINYGTTTTTTGSSTSSGTTSGTSTGTSGTANQGSDNGGTSTTTTGTSNTTTLDDNGGLTAITTGDNTTLVRDDGTDVTSERIEDDSNPLAAPATSTDEGTEGKQEGDAKQTEQGVSPVAIGGIIAVAIAAGVGLFLMLKKKGESDDEETF